MARLTAAEVERFKRNTDLVALVRQHGVALKKHGSRDLAGCCPFHAEKTASFIVTPSKNLFHCLGCGAAGGPIDFIMKSQNLPFRAAVSGRGAALHLRMLAHPVAHRRCRCVWRRRHRRLLKILRCRRNGFRCCWNV